jgi:hypothetical protein
VACLVTGQPSTVWYVKHIFTKIMNVKATYHKRMIARFTAETGILLFGSRHLAAFSSPASGVVEPAGHTLLIFP